jgi:hypothetical protein
LNRLHDGIGGFMKNLQISRVAREVERFAKDHLDPTNLWNNLSGRLNLGGVEHCDRDDWASRFNRHASDSGATLIEAAIRRTCTFWIDADAIAGLELLNSGDCIGI